MNREQRKKRRERIVDGFIYEEKTNKYTKEELIKIINNLAKEKIKANLKQDEKILLQKTTYQDASPQFDSCNLVQKI